jgi:hypothetical protein
MEEGKDERKETTAGNDKGTETMKRNVFILVAVAAFCLGTGILVGWGIFDDHGGDDEGKLGGIDSAFLAVPYELTLDPTDFVEGVDNPFFPLVPGTTMVYEGKSEDETEKIVFHVLNETRVVSGITCIVVRDTVYKGDEMIEDTSDWYAQDKEGNVWYMGEDTAEYEDGKIINHDGAWESGVNGAVPGIIMQANPRVGMYYRQEYLKGEAEDFGAIISLDESVTVPFGTYTGCLRTWDFVPSSPDVIENKWFAPGVGFVKEEKVKGGKEVVELVDVYME